VFSFLLYVEVWRVGKEKKQFRLNIFAVHNLLCWDSQSNFVNKKNQLIVICTDAEPELELEQELWCRAIFM
jgi:hypothetical protein